MREQHNLIHLVNNAGDEVDWAAVHCSQVI